jgi:hypothetical protein
MAEANQLSPDEIVWRRIPATTGWVQNGKVDPAAFLPNKGGKKDGISLAWVATAREAAATGRRGKQFYAVSLRVEYMQGRGLIIKSDMANHAYIEGWIWEKRDKLEQFAEYLCTICGAAEGPFYGECDPAANPD